MPAERPVRPVTPTPPAVEPLSQPFSSEAGCSLTSSSTANADAGAVPAPTSILASSIDPLDCLFEEPVDMVRFEMPQPGIASMLCFSLCSPSHAVTSGADDTASACSADCRSLELECSLDLDPYHELSQDSRSSEQQFDLLPASQPQSPPRSPTVSATTAQGLASSPYAVKNSDSRCRPPSQQQHTGCNCASLVLDRMAATAPRCCTSSRVAADQALVEENNTRLIMTRILKCAACNADPTTVQLALIYVDSTLEVLQKTVHCELKPPLPQPCWSAPEQTRPSLPRTSSHVILDPTGDGKSRECHLHVGRMQIAHTGWLRFLGGIIQGRATELASAVEDLRATVAAPGEDDMARATLLMADHVSKKLHTIIGWIKLWGL